MHNQVHILRRKVDLPLGSILGVFVILSLIYAWATPPLEASDELWHFGMVNNIADTGLLPVQHPGVKTVYEQEGSQPPLYYVIAAFLVQGIDRSDFDVLRQPNPHAVAGVPGNIGNKNLVLHDTPQSPFQGTALAVYVIRLFSILCGCITVVSIYAAARQLSVLQPALPILAASLTAFNPMFLFISASVNNDNLVTALNCLIIWQIVVLVGTDKLSFRRSLGIGILIALASLSKLGGLVLLPFVLLAGGWVFYRPVFYNLLPLQKLNWRGLFKFVFVICSAWLILAGWWYVRNLMLYGELFGTTTMVAVAGARIGGFSLQTLVDEFQGFRFAFWALFGAVNIMTFRWFYDVMDAVTVLIMLGLLTALVVDWRSRPRIWRNSENSSWLDVRVTALILSLIVVTGTVSVVVWTSQTYASQGRLLFPFNAAISILGACGIIYFFRYWLRRSIPKRLLGAPLVKRVSSYYVFPVMLGSFALIVPFASIAPEYRMPEALDRLPETAHSVYANYGDWTLVGYETPEQRYFPGDYLPVTVYWQVDQPSVQDYSLYLHATLDDGTVIGKVDSYPGAGRLRTSTWQAGGIYGDTYAIRLDPSSRAVSGLRVQVGWWDYESNMLVNAADGNELPLKSVMLDVGGFAPARIVQESQIIKSIDAINFGDAISLVGYRLDGQSLILSWRSTARLSTNYTVFVQALDTDNHVAGQGDAPPTLPTRYWQVGERFITQHTIAASDTIPLGTYHIILGWYDPVAATRLGISFPDNAYVLPESLIIR